MTNIELKSIKHISQTLESVDTYDVYKALNAALKEYNVDPLVQPKIIEVYQKAADRQFSKCREAKAWADAIIKDTK